MCVPQTNVYVALNPIETVNVTDFKGKSEDECKKGCRYFESGKSSD